MTLVAIAGASDSETMLNGLRGGCLQCWQFSVGSMDSKKLMVSQIFNVGDVDASQSSSVRPRTRGKLQNFCDVRRLCSILKVALNQRGGLTRG
jgi:hypothetical protein